MYKSIHVLSDSLGETADKLLRAAIAQFEEPLVDITRHGFLDSSEKLLKTLEEIQGRDNLVVYTLVSREMRERVRSFCEERGITSVDLMGHLLHELEHFLGEKALEQSGISNKLDQSYYQGVEAVEFAVKYDDGKDPRGIMKADIVLLGISRTSKTPLSMYLANLSYKVANFPIVPEIELPKELFNPRYKEKIFGLTHELETLLRIRRERMNQMGFTEPNTYTQSKRIEEELQFAQDIYDRIGCDVISVSGSAVEETANIIIKKIEERKDILDH